MIDMPSCGKHALLRIGRRCSLLVIAMWLLNACSSLLPAGAAPPSLYSLDDTQTKANPARAPASNAPTLVLGLPRAAPGFDTQRMMYVREPHRLEYFRTSEWANPPAAMLAPLIASALEKSGAFAAVVQSPTSALGRFRLQLEIVRLQQEFLTLPSHAHFTLRAHFLDLSSRQVVAWREFDVVAQAPSDDPYGGVIAANQAVHAAITQLVAFCADAVRTAPSPASGTAHGTIPSEEPGKKQF
jgi:cholesterol transport system auxiliary component